MAGARPEGVGILAMDIYFPSTYVKQSSLETFDGVSEGVVCPPPPCGPQLNLVPVWTRHATSTQQPLHLPRPPPFRLSHHSEPPTLHTSNVYDSGGVVDPTHLAIAIIVGELFVKRVGARL